LSTVEVDLINFAFSPSSVTIHVGDTVHWVWKTSDHSTTSVAGSAVSWDSGVHNSGFTFDVTFQKAGTFNYYCKIHGFDNGDGTAGGMAGSVIVEGAPTLESIAVTPANPSVPKGLTQQFDAVGTYSDNSTQDLTTQVTWASSKTAVATISNAAGKQGLATAVAQGSSTISATLGNINGSTVMTVSPAVLQSIAVTPANPSVAKGLTEQFTATGTYSDSSTQDLTTQVTWASATTSVATISNSSGSQGLATTVSTGTSKISAAMGGISGSTTLTVTAAALESIAVTPANPSIAKGLTQQFTATGTYTDSTKQDLTSQVTWASADTTVATITAAGLATAKATGSSKISATMGSISGSTTLTVTAAALESIAVTPANPSIAKGTTQQFTATGTYSDNSTQNLTSQVTWASATTSVATISAAGLATAKGTGSSKISATMGSISGSTTLTVTAAALESIAVTPANPQDQCHDGQHQRLDDPHGHRRGPGVDRRHPRQSQHRQGTHPAVHRHRHLLGQLDSGLDQPGDLGLGHHLGRHDLRRRVGRGRGHRHLQDQRHDGQHQRLDDADGHRGGPGVDRRHPRQSHDRQGGHPAVHGHRHLHR
jgi:plastocyanin